MELKIHGVLKQKVLYKWIGFLRYKFRAQRQLVFLIIINAVVTCVQLYTQSYFRLDNVDPTFKSYNWFINEWIIANAEGIN